MTTKTYLTVPEIAKLADVHRRTVKYWIDTGKLVAYRVGYRYRVRPEDWQAFLDACNQAVTTD